MTSLLEGWSRAATIARHATVLLATACFCLLAACESTDTGANGGGNVGNNGGNDELPSIGDGSRPPPRPGSSPDNPARPAEPGPNPDEVIQTPDDGDPPQSVAGLGSECRLGCGPDFFCIADGDDAYCSRRCDTAASNCPEGYGCLPLGTGGAACARSAGGPLPDPPPVVNVGAPCADGCGELFCVADHGETFCTDYCTPGDSVCPTSFACLPLIGGNNACGRPPELDPDPDPEPDPDPDPDPGISPLDAIGQPCESACPGDPGAVYCLRDGESTYCSFDCGPSMGACPRDFFCAELQGGGGACARIPEPEPEPDPEPDPPTGAGFGEPCGEGCGGGLLCLRDGQGTYCTGNCDFDVDCPNDYFCAALQGGGGACAVAPQAPDFSSDRDCRSDCLDLLPFPQGGRGDGYRVMHGADYSWARRDLIQLVRYASAEVLDAFPRTSALGLGDMSESNGDTPGADRGRLRHPAGSHESGNDIDIAYYQVNTPDNALRIVCPRNDGYNCTGPATLLEPERTALFLARLYESSRVRVIGVDVAVYNQIMPVVEEWNDAGLLDDFVYEKFYSRLAADREGWPFHHHHLHLSLSRSGVSALASTAPYVDGAGLDMDFAAGACGFQLFETPAPQVLRYYEVRRFED